MSQQSELWLMLMRHGEAEDPTRATPDFSRALTDHGRHAAFSTATSLKNQYFLPQVGFSSDATRAQQTAEEMAQAWGGYRWIWTRSLYHAGLPDISHCIESYLKNTPDHHLPQPRSIICVGHNPGWSYAASRLTNEYVALATANLIVMRIQASHWHDALQMQGCWDLCEVIQPS